MLTLLTILVCCAPCSGQVNKDLPKEEQSESHPISIGQPKLIKTQGSHQADNVNCSLQDKAGNLWFGTTGEGVYKYDGKSFIQFTKSNGLNSNTVCCIFEDQDANIWIGTDAGACLYDGKTFANVHIALPKNTPPNKYWNTHDVFSIMQDKSGKLWFATIDGVLIYDGKSFTPFTVNEGVGGFKSSNNNVERILEDKAGNVWFGGRANEGVYRYDGKSVTNLKLSETKDSNWAWPALQDSKGNVWFSNWRGAYRYDGKSFTRFATTTDGLNVPVTRIIEDKKGNLWFGGAGGICRYDGNSFTRFATKDGPLNNEVWSILEDNNGILWVGTRDTGLYRFDGKAFTKMSE